MPLITGTAVHIAVAALLFGVGDASRGEKNVLESEQNVMIQKRISSNQAIITNAVYAGFTDGAQRFAC